jgi:hypothetical protein
MMDDGEIVYQDPYNSTSSLTQAAGYQQHGPILQDEQQRIHNIAASIGDDWNLLDEHMNNLLNPKK